jgi:ComF family protein
VKYFGNARVAALLGAILAQYVQKVVMGPTILVPIPLSRRRLRERGYNQVELIATACCTALPPAPRRLVQLEPDFLTKRHIKSQTTKDRGQRRSSIKNCFRTSQEKIKKYDSDQPIILIDDVITTGATLHEALATLATAGFTNVCALTIAHTALKRGMHDGSQAS